MIRAALFAMVMLAALPARAEPPVTLAEARDAIAIYDEGKRLQRKGDLEGAILLFREADAMYPGALPKYRMAVCLDALGRTKEALAAYRAFLDAAERPKHDDLVELVRTRLGALEKPVRVAANVSRPRVRAAEAHRDIDATASESPTAMRVTGFVLLAATLGTGAAFAATFAQSRLAAEEPERQRLGVTAGVLAPITGALALATVVVLPLSFRGDVETSAFVGPASMGFSGRF